MKYLLILLPLLLLTACTQTVEETIEVQEMNEETEMNKEVSFAENANYILDTENSELNWFASKIVGSHEGTVGISSGNLQIENSLFTGQYTIDMTTITSDSDRVTSHLENEDFFNIEMYPTSTFVITSIDGSKVTGDLTILDQTNEIMFDADFSQEENGVRVTASFEIDRTRWGINFKSASLFSDLGNGAIKDEIQYDLNLLFVEE